MSACSIHDLALKFPDQHHRQRKTHLLQGSEHAWRVFLDLRAGMTVLDLGCGFGARSESLLEHGVTLIAIETSDLAARFAHDRLLHCGSRCTVPPTVVRLGSLDRLPVATASIDLLLLPVDLDPRSAAQSAAAGVRDLSSTAARSLGASRAAMLREATRTLKPGGQAVLVGENRWALDRMLDEIRPFSEKAPRVAWSANLGLRAYRRAMRSLGGRDLETFSVRRDRSGTPCALADRRIALPPDRTPTLKSRIKGLTALAQEFVIIAGAHRRAGSTSLERIVDSVSNQLRDNGMLNGTLRIEGFHLSRKDKLIVELGTGFSTMILRLPLSPGARSAERSAGATLHLLMRTRAAETWFPRVLCRGDRDGFEFSLEEKAPGIALGASNVASSAAHVLAEASGMLELLNPGLQDKASVVLEGELYQRLVTEPLERITGWLDSNDEAERVRAFLRRSLLGLETRIGLQHGDFGRSNILCTESGRRTLIDWEDSLTQGLPVLDAISMLASLAPPRGLGESLGAHRHRLAFGAADANQHAFLERQYERAGTARAAHPALVYLNWVHFASGLLKFSFMQQPEFLRFYVKDVVAELLRSGMDQRPASG